MVKVFAPVLSLDASGTIGDALTFSKWKGRHYARERIIPSNPKSGLQVGFRSMFKFLAQNWAGLTGVEQATYDELADSLAISPFNAYVRMNQARWKNFYSPSKDYTVLAAGTIGVWNGGTPTATGGIASITIDWNLATLNDNWGMIIFRSPTGTFSTGLSNAIAAVLLDSTGAGQYVDTPLTPGTYYYDTRLFTDEGLLGAEDGEINAAAS